MNFLACEFSEKKNNMLRFFIHIFISLQTAKTRVAVKEAAMLKTTKAMLAAPDPEAAAAVAAFRGVEVGACHAAGVALAVRVEADPGRAVVAEAEAEAGPDLAARADHAAEVEAAAEEEAVAVRRAVRKEVTVKVRLRKRRKRKKNVLFLVQIRAAQTANEMMMLFQEFKFGETGFLYMQADSQTCQAALFFNHWMFDETVIRQQGFF